jgi:hypothetical protein
MESHEEVTLKNAKLEKKIDESSLSHTEKEAVKTAFVKYDKAFKVLSR